MRVLTAIAHLDRRSFCHAVLQQFTAALTNDGTRRRYLERAYTLGKEFADA